MQCLTLNFFYVMFLTTLVTLPVETVKKSRPPIPVPYGKVKSPDLVEAGNSPSQARVLQRTKSLENVLLKAASEGKGSPLLPRKEPALKPLAKNVPSNGYDHIKPLPNPKPVQVGNKKPEAAKKKPYHKFKIPGSESKPEPVISSPLMTASEHKESNPTPPPPTVPPPSSSKHQKTYTAIENYTSQAHGCLSFTTGERCVLIKQSTGGWWYVNISGQEGWTPGEFWEEEKRVRVFTLCHN